MKKLLLIGAILAIGTTAFAVNPTGGKDGFSVNLDGDTMYEESYKVNKYVGTAAGFDQIKDITSNDSTVHRDKAVNIFRDKGEGWSDTAGTLVLLNVLEPVIIESEVDILYTEAVIGDELQIGDLGFRVKGMGSTDISFRFEGEIFDTLGGEVTAKGFNGFFPMQQANLGSGVEVLSQNVTLDGTQEEIEIDMAFDLRGADSGLKFGTIIARAEYQ